MDTFKKALIENKINLSKRIDIYTDGACSGTPGPAGAGIVFIQDSKIFYKISKPIGIATNNVAELSAIYFALKEIKGHKNVFFRVTTDSKYCIGAITMNWKIKANIALIFKIKRLVRKFSKLTFKHCRGHSGIYGNECADHEAVKAKKMNGQPKTEIEDDMPF